MQQIVQTDFSKEALEVVGQKNFKLEDTAIVGGKTCLRLNDCDGFWLRKLEISGMRASLGPNSQDGHGIQLINSSGKLEDIDISATDDSEDLLNIYGDKLETLNKLVIVRYVRTRGRSKSNSCTHICIDGPFPPKVLIQFTRGVHSRCYMTIAGGSNHQVSCCESYGCEDTDLWISNVYGKADMKGITVQHNNFPNIAIGSGVNVNYNNIQNGGTYAV